MKNHQPKSGTRIQRIGYYIKRLAFFVFVLPFFLQICVAIFPLTEKLTNWLSCQDIKPVSQPKYILLIAGSIPSQSGLIRAYYAAVFGRGYTGITYIISMPSYGDPTKGGPGLVKDELVLRGVSPNDIIFESKGKNTYEEAVYTRAMLGDMALNEPLVIVTSPSHMRRAFLCVRKQGFMNVTCLSAGNVYHHVDIGGWGFFRYTFWNRFAAMPEIARELVALTVYNLRGWI